MSINDLLGTLDTHSADPRVVRFETAWRNRRDGEPPPCWQDYLPAENETAHAALVFLLLRTDIEYRVKAQLPALLREPYFNHPRFQQADVHLDAEQQIQLIRWEYEQRWRQGERARRQAYQQAFPTYADALNDLKPHWTCPRCRRPIVVEETAETLSCPNCESDSPRSTTAPEEAGGEVEPPRLDLRGYQLLERLGGGGMGDVYRADDPALGRDLAVKVMKADLQGHPMAERRFLREARVTGSLQHPGIVPVYNLGRLADGRLHYTMRLVRGRTFAAILKEEAGRPERLPELLTIFEKICQAVAYAHSKKVIHRDLKPANVMVGRFGEVQVMDWGLAKLLTAEGEPEAAEGAGDSGGTRIHTEEAATPPEMTRMGREMGTPAYMPPEQALGEWDAVDERADVFALGAILCEILTGQPPYSGRDGAEALRKARRGENAEALARLEVCGVDAVLAALCRACLTPAPEGRPRNAEEVARRLAVYQTEVQERLRRAELERTAAVVRAAEERKRRRLTAVLASVVLLAMLAGGGAFLLAQRQKQARQEQTARLVQQALGQATALRKQALEAPLEDAAQRERAAALWRDTRAAADRAEQALADGEADAETSHQASELLTELRQQAAEADRDRRMLQSLDQAHEMQMELQESDYARKRRVEEFVFGLAAVPAYAAAFREYGIDVETLSTEEAIARIRERPIRFQLAVALDDWYFLAPEAAGGRLLDISRGADPDPLRDRVREAIARQDRAALKKLAGSEEALKLPVPTLILLADVLHQMGLRSEGMQLLKRARSRHPDDFWVNDVLGLHLQSADPPDYAGAARCFEAATALRPQSPVGWSNLGTTLIVRGQLDDAVAVLREAIRIKPDFPVNYERITTALLEKGELEQASTLVQEALRRHPESPMLRTTWGQILVNQGKQEQAIAAFRQVLARHPEWVQARTLLADALAATGAVREALELLDEAERTHPELSMIHATRGAILLNEANLEGALAAFRKAVELSPGDVTGWSRLAHALTVKGQPEEALALHRKAIRIAPENAVPHVFLADSLHFLGRRNEAEAEDQLAIQLNPRSAYAHNGLGLILGTKGQFPDAERAFRQAIALRPWDPWFHCNLADLLRKQKDFVAAITVYEQAIKLKPRESHFHHRLGHAYYEQGKSKEAIPHYLEALRLKPGDLTVTEHLANAIFASGMKAGAIKLLRETVQRNPNAVLLQQNLADKLAQVEQYDDGIEAGKKAVELAPRLASTHFALAVALGRKGRFDEAIAEFRRAIELNPLDPVSHAQMGHACFAAKKYAEALVCHLLAARLTPKNAIAHESVGKALAALQRYHEAADAYQRAADLEPDTLRYSAELALVYQYDGRIDDAIRLYEQTLKRYEEKSGAKHPDTLLVMAAQGVAYQAAGRLDEAISRLETALERGRQESGELPPALERVPATLADYYERAGKLAKAEAIYRDLLKKVQQRFGPKDARTASVLVFLGVNLLKQKQFNDAESLLRTCLEVRAAKQPDDWTTFNTRSALGEALVGLKKYAEAEPLLREGYDGMIEQQEKIPLPVRQMRLMEALERLVQLYEATEKKDKAGEWRKKLERAKKRPKNTRPS